MIGLYGEKFRETVGIPPNEVFAHKKTNHMKRLCDHDNKKGLECFEYRNILTTSLKIIEGKHTQNECTQKTQERRLKRLITLGGLEIGIQHQIVNALELSTHPPKKKKKINK